MKQRITKKDVISSIFSQSNASREDVSEVLDLLIENVTQALEQGKSVGIRGFGTFLVRKRKERYNAQNPHKTWEKTHIPEHYVVFFRPGRRLRARVWFPKGE